MLSVTVNDESNVREQYHLLDSTPESYFKVFLLVGGVTLIVLAPLLSWLIWHRQWVALAALGCWVLYLWRTLFVRRQRALDDSLREQGPVTYTLLPDGLLLTAKQNNYTYRVWPQFETPAKNANGLKLKYAVENLYFFIPRVSFSNEAEYDAFAAQAIKFHSSANPSLANVIPNFREPEATPRYVLHYQQPNAPIDVSDATAELRQQFPHTFPEQKEMPKWKAYLIGLLLLGTFILFLNPFDNKVDSNYTRGTMLIFVMYFGYIWLLIKAYLWIHPRWMTKTVSRQLPELVLSLSESGLRCAQLGNESTRSWSNLDAVVHRGNKITLWRGAVLQDIIPDTAFATPEDAAACAEWIFQKLAPPQEPRASDPLPKQPLSYPPDTDNPYQAPRYS